MPSWLLNHCHDCRRRFLRTYRRLDVHFRYSCKTGVGGGVMGVLPGQFGIAAFAPPLDGSGNSVKAQLAIQYIMNKLELNVFSNNHITVVD